MTAKTRRRRNLELATTKQSVQSSTDIPPSEHQPSKNGLNLMAAAIYVLSGCARPIIMRLIKDAGLADPTCQLYMLFFYFGPSFFLIPVALEGWDSRPSKSATLKACGISLISMIMNYMGAALAGPAIFGIVYSSVAIWTAVLSRILFKRKMSLWQWTCVFVVFCGRCHCQGCIACPQQRVSGCHSSTGGLNHARTVLCNE